MISSSTKTILASLSAAALLSAQQPVRFDHVVRNDYFAGFNGNREALQRAMNITTDVLKTDPKHAEAMVWHGSGLFFQSGGAFQSGDQEKGMELFTQGIGMMDKAVELAPNNVGVRIPRGAVLLQATPYMPEEVATPLVEKALSDYLRAYELQKSSLDNLGQHPKGELLFGIADGYSRTGNSEKAKEWFTMVTKMMPDTAYSKRAQIWLEKGKLTPQQIRCVGCHTGSSAAPAN